MKTNCMILLACLFSTQAMSQTQKGSKLLGSGLGGFSVTNSESTTTYSNTPTVYKSEGSSMNLSIYPNIGYFLANNFALGAYLSTGIYTSNSTSSNTSSNTTSTSKYTNPSFYIGPFARFYFGSDSKGKPFAETGITFGRYGGTSKSASSQGSSSETKTKPDYDRNFRFLVGYEYFFSTYLGLFASFGIQMASSRTTYEYRPSSGTGYDYTSSYKSFYTPLTVGLQIHCPGKQNKATTK